MSMDEHQSHLPKTRLNRIYRLAKLSMGLAKDAAGSAAKKVIHKGADKLAASEELLHRQVATKLYDTLGEMKGLAMKVGQMMSYIDDFIPREYRHIYQEILGRLQVAARPMAWAEIETVIREDLGKHPDELFAAFDRTPIASASIGQVYRATLLDGQQVAVKIQYPDIAQAIHSDVRNIEMLKSILGLVLREMDVERSLADIEARVAEEIDYGCEMNNQLEFYGIYEHDPDIVIPRVYPELCGERVLTSEYIEGRGYYEMLSGTTQEERNRIGIIMFRFVFGSLYLHGIFNADPHPGNYLFLEDGRVAFLDFGCVQRFHRQAIEEFARVRRLAMNGDREGMAEAMLEAYGLPDLDEEEMHYLVEYLLYCFRPVLEDRMFKLDRDYTEELVELSYRGVRIGMRKVLAKGVREAKREGLIFLNRLQYGFNSVLGNMEVEANFHRIMHDLDHRMRSSGGAGWVD